MRSDTALAGQEVGPPLPGAVTAGHPPGFENAARAEHQNEALAMRHMLSQQQVRGWPHPHPFKVSQCQASTGFALRHLLTYHKRADFKGRDSAMGCQAGCH